MKLRDYLIGAGLGLASLVNVSCAPMTPEEKQRSDERLLMLGLGYKAILEDDPQKAAVMGFTSDVLRDYDLAKEGRDQIIIINGTNYNKSEENDEPIDLGPAYPLNKDGSIFIDPKNPPVNLGPARPLNSRKVGDLGPARPLNKR